MTIFRRNLFSNALATVIGSGAQFFLILSLPHWLSVGIFASFLTATAVVAVGEMASDFGCRILAIKQFATSTSPKNVFLSVVIAKFIFSFVAASIVLMLPFHLLTLSQLVLVIFIAITQPSTDPLLWYLIGRERLDIEAGIRLTWRISNVVIIAIFAYNRVNLIDLLFVWLGVNLLRIAIVWHFPFINSVKDKKDKIDKNKILIDGFRTVRLAFPIGVAFLLMTVYQRLGVLLLGQIADVHSVAIYGVAFTLVASAGFVATSITLSSFPLLSKALADNEWFKVNQVIERKLKLIMVVFLPACVIGAFISPYVISFFYPRNYIDASLVIFALLPGLYISSINFALKYVMNALRLNWLDALSAAVGIFVFTCFLLIPSWHILAIKAGWAWCFGEVCVFLIKWFAIKSDHNEINLTLGRHLLIFAVLFTGAFLFSDSYALWVKTFY